MAKVTRGCVSSIHLPTESHSSSTQWTHPNRRILKAFVDAQWLADFDARLDAYRRHLENPGEENSDD